MTQQIEVITLTRADYLADIKEAYAQGAQVVLDEFKRQSDLIKPALFEDEAAEYLRKPKRELAELRKAGVIPHVRHSKNTIYYRRSDLDNYMLGLDCSESAISSDSSIESKSKPAR